MARAKAEIFAGLEPGGVAVLNADNPWFDLLKAEARRRPAPRSAPSARARAATPG